jgi:hypothetical protein
MPVVIKSLTFVPDLTYKADEQARGPEGRDQHLAEPENALD